jgi:S1-C subfamily serine protease
LSVPTPSQPLSVADLVEDALSSVVNIRVKSLQEGVFGDVEEAEGQGSGVITDASG